MGGPRNNTAVLSEDRKAKMRQNYTQNKDKFNRSKIIREIELHKRLYVNQPTIYKYQWTPEQLQIINTHNKMYKDERTRPRPIVNLPEPIVLPRPRPETPQETRQDPPVITDKTYTKDMAATFLKNRLNPNTNKPYDSTVNISRINPLLKLFGVKSTDLMEIYNKLSEKEITAKIV